MYLKVHSKRAQWFRDDGTLVGEELKSTDRFYNHVHHIIKTVDKKYVQVVFGYFKDAKSFVPLCLPYCSPDKCKMHKSDICWFKHNTDPTAGYYIFYD